MRVIHRLVRCGLALSTVLFSLSLSASSDLDPNTLSSWKLISDDDSQLQLISEKVEIVSRKGNEFEIYVPIKNLDWFLDTAPSARLIKGDISADFKINLEKDPNYFAGYRRLDEVYAAMKTLETSNPEIVKMVQIGESTEGRPQWAFKLSDNAASDEDEPELMLTAATHGDEIITTETILRFMEELVAGYQSNQRMTNIIDNNEIYFIPVVNPDGFYKRERYAGGRDPNRDYPWPERPNVSSVACIKNIRDFFDSRNFVGSIDFHAYGKLVMYPWGYTRNAPDSQDELVFSNLANAMSEANSYTAGQISRVIYVAKGSSADYYYWSKNTLAYGVELGRSKAPRSNQIPAVLEETREMTLKFLESF